MRNDINNVFTADSQRKFMRAGKATLSTDDVGAARIPYYGNISDNYPSNNEFLKTYYKKYE